MLLFLSKLLSLQAVVLGLACGASVTFVLRQAHAGQGPDHEGTTMGRTARQVLERLLRDAPTESTPPEVLKQLLRSEPEQDPSRADEVLKQLLRSEPEQDPSRAREVLKQLLAR